jgi:glycosyltransferase involved in cell wall biosynthesis
LSFKANPSVSVILPFYNAEGTLNRSIESFYKQSYTNFECILIDNNSTDGGAVIAKYWSENDSRFILEKELQQGVMFASNKGAKQGKVHCPYGC